MLSFLWFWIFGKERAISSKKVTKAPKDCIQAEEERMLPKMKATCHTYACKLVFNTRPQVNNERQQEREESGQKLPVEIVPRPLDGDRHNATARLRGSQPRQNRWKDLSFSKRSLKANES